MIVEITCELTSLNDMSPVTSEKVLAWAKKVQAKRYVKAVGAEDAHFMT